MHRLTVESLAYAEKAEQAEGQQQWDDWLTWVTTPPADHAEFVRMTTTDREVLAALPPPGWSQAEATAAREYMRLRAGG